MPPHVEVDSHNDDCHLRHSASLPLLLSNDKPSPLFLDYETISKTTSPLSPTSLSLSRRQSDPNFQATIGNTQVVPKVDPVKAAAAPVVSRITAIIGPESAYVRNTSSSTTATANTAASGSAAKPKPQQQKVSSSAPKKQAAGQTKGKAEGRPILLRATRYVSKKGWKVVKSLPQRVASSARSVKVPGHHRNVV